MRFPWVVAAAGLLFGGGCSSGDPAPSKDTLVLELGGENRSLRADLAAAGIVIVPAVAERHAAPVEAALHGNRGEEQPETATDPISAPPSPQPGPAAPPRQEVPTTELREGETLIHVARRCLGDGRRYRDLMAWNDWSDAQVRRLQIGTKVKLAPPDGR